MIDRRRAELADPAIARPVRPYHAAAKLELKEAEEYVRHFADQAKVRAQQALCAVIPDVVEMGCEVVTCGILVGSGRSATTLKAILACHPQLHTAEGELFRNALIHASNALGLPVLGIKEKVLLNLGTVELSLALDASTARSRFRGLARNGENRLH